MRPSQVLYTRSCAFLTDRIYKKPFLQNDSKTLIWIHLLSHLTSPWSLMPLYSLAVSVDSLQREASQRDGKMAHTVNSTAATWEHVSPHRKALTCRAFSYWDDMHVGRTVEYKCVSSFLSMVACQTWMRSPYSNRHCRLVSDLNLRKLH